jgi:peptide-methionine (R)-S-oxide reductase
MHSTDSMRALAALLFCATTIRGGCLAFAACRRSSPRQSPPIVLYAEQQEPNIDTSNPSGFNDDSTDTNTNAGTGTWNPFSLAVLRLGFTEPAWTSPLNYQKAAGTYKCASCGTALFSSNGKFDSGSGWPSFWKTASSDRVELKKERDGRIECRCLKCNGHLGHVFPDGPTRGSLDAMELASVPETDPKIGYKVQNDSDSSFSRMPRYCVNGVALKFEKES